VTHEIRLGKSRNARAGGCGLSLRRGFGRACGDAPWPLFTSQTSEPAILTENIPSLGTIIDAQFATDHHCDLWDPLANY
jgi:hypothetical protein